jgi:hypothetical protein
VPTKTLVDDPSGENNLRHNNTQALGGAGRDRTDDPLLAKQVLSQLSYSPKPVVGGSGWIRTIDPRLIKTVL